jgi:hypothetical protein
LPRTTDTFGIARLAISFRASRPSAEFHRRQTLRQELHGALARQFPIRKEDRTAIHDDRSTGEDRRVQVPLEPIEFASAKVT